MYFYPAHQFLEKDGTLTNAEKNYYRVRQVNETASQVSELGSHPKCKCLGSYNISILPEIME